MRLNVEIASLRKKARPCLFGTVGLLMALASWGCVTLPRPSESGAVPRVVWEIKFTGNKALTAATLLRAMETAATSGGAAITRLGKYSLFTEAVLQADIKRIQKVYRYHGYYETRISQYELVPLSEPRSYRRFERVRLNLTIDEGRPLTLRKLRLVWNGRDLDWKKLTPEQKLFTAKLPLEESKRFGTPEYQTYKQLLLQRLREKSYALAEIRGQAVIDKDDAWAEAKYTVETGPKCIFGDITLATRGKTKKVNEELIRKLFTFKKGEVFRLQSMLDTQRVLFGTGLFKTVDFKPDLEGAKKLAGVPRPIPISLSLQEDQFQIIKLGGGFAIDGQRNQVEAAGTWTLLNFGGALGKLELQLQLGWAFLPDILRIYDMGPDITASLAFKQPIFALQQGEFGARLLYRYVQQIGDTDFQTVTPSVWFSMAFLRNLTFRVSFNLEVAFGVQNPLTLDRESYVLSYLEQQLVWDTRDDPIQTTRGTLLLVSLQQAGIGGNFAYFKASPEFRFFIPLPAKIVLAGRFQYGILFSQRIDGSSSPRDPSGQARTNRVLDVLHRSPNTQRFFLGGANNVRGWTARYLGPLACQVRRQTNQTQTREDPTDPGQPITAFQQRVNDTQTIPGAGQLPLDAAGNPTTNPCVPAAGQAAQARFGDMARYRNALPSDGYAGTPVLAQDNLLQIVPMGGEQMIYGSLELRIPLDFLVSNLGIVAFMDLGVVQLERVFWDEKAGSPPADLFPAFTVGGGIRYKTPIGPVRLDIAARIGPDDSRYPLQRHWQFHFSIGEAF